MTSQLWIMQIIFEGGDSAEIEYLKKMIRCDSP